MEAKPLLLKLDAIEADCVPGEKRAACTPSALTITAELSAVPR